MKHYQLIASVYTVLTLIVASILIITDLGIFPYWGFRLDKTVFIYLTSPREVLASAQWWVWVAGLIAMVALFSIGWLAYKKFVTSTQLENLQTARQQIVTSSSLLLLTSLLFLPIRGSLTVSTMNTGRVYFSDNRSLNLAAVNPAFNLLESMSEQTFDTERYTYMPEQEARLIVDSLTQVGTSDMPQFLRTQRPNIVLVIWESMSANAWEAMPCTRQLAESGIWFTRGYASSFRTDRGVVAVLSGFPGQPTSSLMTAPSKTKSLNYVSRDLQQEGYQLHWYYGGDEDFTNMRSYLTYAGFEDRTCDRSFPIADRLSKWGVPDHILLDYCDKTIRSRNDTLQHFDVILTLSSHEPFEVPSKRRFDNDYLNSMAYTDSCLGAFADSLRMSPQWDNTLLVVMGDHGYPYPTDVQNHEPRRYNLPIIMTGGAITQSMTISTICSQIDWIPTLLDAMEIESQKYIFSKNAFTAANHWAIYAFNDGWGIINPTDTLIYDRKNEKNVFRTDSTTQLEHQSKAFLQTIYQQIDSLTIK